MPPSTAREISPRLMVTLALAGFAAWIAAFYFLVGFGGEYGSCNPDADTFNDEFGTEPLDPRPGRFSLFPPGRECEALKPVPFPGEGAVVDTAVFPPPHYYLGWAVFIFIPYWTWWLGRVSRSAGRRLRYGQRGGSP